MSSKTVDSQETQPDDIEGDEDEVAFRPPRPPTPAFKRKPQVSAPKKKAEPTTAPLKRVISAVDTHLLQKNQAESETDAEVVVDDEAEEEGEEDVAETTTTETTNETETLNVKLDESQAEQQPETKDSEKRPTKRKIHTEEEDRAFLTSLSNSVKNSTVDSIPIASKKQRQEQQQQHQEVDICSRFDQLVEQLAVEMHTSPVDMTRQLIRLGLMANPVMHAPVSRLFASLSSSSSSQPTGSTNAGANNTASSLSNSTAVESSGAASATASVPNARGENSGKPWTDQENVRLVKMYQKDPKDLDSLAHEFKRTEKGIVYHLAQLGLPEPKRLWEAAHPDQITTRTATRVSSVFAYRNRRGGRGRGSAAGQ